jgi:hypothetical protein
MTVKVTLAGSDIPTEAIRGNQKAIENFIASRKCYENCKIEPSSIRRYFDLIEETNGVEVFSYLCN